MYYSGLSHNNPYYNPERLDLELHAIEEQNMHYEYNALCFWATKDGRIYSASDSGCSCPTPFENYSGGTQDEVVQKLERVENLNHALRIFDSWNQGYIPGVAIVPEGERQNLTDFIRTHIITHETQSETQLHRIHARRTGGNSREI